MAEYFITERDWVFGALLVLFKTVKLQVKGDGHRENKGLLLLQDFLSNALRFKQIGSTMHA